MISSDGLLGAFKVTREEWKSAWHNLDLGEIGLVVRGRYSPKSVSERAAMLMLPLW